MAYMSQENKKQLAANLKAALKGSGLKYSLGVSNHSTITMKITSGPVDFIQNYVAVVSKKPEYERTFDKTITSLRVNEYHYQNQFTGKALDLLKKIVPALNVGNHDRSDIQSDYFDVGWYVDVSIGAFRKPYVVVEN